jgi:hypothetical protein
MNTLVKYLHDLLSVGENVNRYDAKYTHQCASCQQDNETMKHLLMCPAQSRKAWRCLFLTHIRKHLAATETNLELMTIAIDGLHAVLNDTNMDHSKYPPIYQQLLEEQESIGWTNFLKGRMTTQWALHQNRHFKERGLLNSKTNGTTWATNLASKMLNEWLGLWKIRNEDRHGKDRVAQTKARAEQIRREVELLYEQADQAPPANIDHIYKNNLETQLEKTTAELIGWLSNWGPVVHQHQQQLRQQEQKERQQQLLQLQEQLLQSQQQQSQTQRQLTIPDSVPGV